MSLIFKIHKTRVIIVYAIYEKKIVRVCEKKLFISWYKNKLINYI